MMTLIEDVARRLWGEPNDPEPVNDELRWGTKGSKSVNPIKQCWYDHEAATGGDVLDMIMFDQELDILGAHEWLEGEGLKHDKPNGNAGFWAHMTASYTYIDEHCNPLFEVHRFDPPGERRKFLQRLAGSKTWGLKDKKTGEYLTRLVLYLLPEVIAAVAAKRTVYVVEGEKCAHQLRELGLTATTAPMGAKHRWRPEYSEPLRGADVVLLPDNDDVGRAHMSEVAGCLAGIAARVQTLTLPGLPDKGDVVEWVAAGGTAQRLEELVTESAATAADPYALRMHGEVDPRTSKKWLVKYLLIEVGIGLLSGQWGTYKTFMLFELVASIVMGLPFINSRFRIKRRCGVLLIAAEGAAEVPLRLEAVVQEKCGGKRVPFIWCEQTPLLLQPGSDQALIAIARKADARLQAEFGVPLGLIIIDTLIVATGYTKAGEENDSSIGQRVMSVMKTLAEAMRAFVLGVDHFGKSVETGTRGTSVKETDCDAVIALLGKEADGQVTDPLLKVRKVRGARAGEEFPFTTSVVGFGVDEDGDPLETLVISWGNPGRRTMAEPKMTPRETVLYQLLVEAVTKGPHETADGVPSGELAITREVAKVHLKARGWWEGDKEHSSRSRFSSIAGILDAKGAIGLTENHIWIKWKGKIG